MIGCFNVAPEFDFESEIPVSPGVHTHPRPGNGNTSSLSVWGLYSCFLPFGFSGRWGIVVACVRLSICPSESTNLFAYPCNNCLAKSLITYANGLLTQCMKRPVAHSLNSTWFWIELPENCCEPLKFIMKYISIQFCERPSHGRPFHALLTHWGRVTHICVGNLTIIGLCNR